MNQDLAKMNQKFVEKIATAIMEHQNLSFLDNCYFLGTVDIKGETATKLAETFYHPINEEDLLTSKRYAQILDFIIDGIVEIRFNLLKKEITFPNIDNVYYYLKSNFEELYCTDDENILSILANYFYKFFKTKKEIQQLITLDSIYQKLELQYKIFSINEILKFDEVAQFLSSLLNDVENTFKSREKKKIIEELTRKLPLTKKRQKTLQTGIDLKKIGELFANHEYEVLHTSKDTLKQEARTLRERLPKCFEIKKAGITINNEQFSQLEDEFALGTLTNQAVMDILKINEKLAKYIHDKYNQLKLKYIKELDKTAQDNKPTPHPSYGFHYNNYQVANNQVCARTLAKLFLLINEQDAQYFLNNKDTLEEIQDLFFFVGFFEELQISELLAILNNYKHIKWKLGVSQKKETVWKKVGDIIALANGYASSTDIEQAVLGNSIKKKIPIVFRKEYGRFYLQMFEKEQGIIPPVSGTFEDLTYQSGDYHNPEHLLIGRNCGTNSCIDLKNIAGKRTYQKILTEEDGDVIFFKKKETGEFYGRMLLFRKGNFVILANPINTQGKIDEYLLNEKLLRDIGNQLISTSKNHNDNIEFVFFVKSYYKIKKHNFPIVADNRFYSCFPHADLTAYAYLIGASKPITENISEQLDVNKKTKVLYPRVRKLPTTEKDAEHIDRLKALAILREEEEEKKEELARAYEPFHYEEYQSVIVGDDWYIALRQDNTLEELLIHEKNPQSIREFLCAKNQLLAACVPKANQGFLGR